MKKNLIMGVLITGTMFVLAFSKEAHAGSTVCAGKTVHYSLYRPDRGAPPPEGMPDGEEFLSIKGSLKGKREFRVGQDPVGTWDLELTFDKKKELYKQGGEVLGASVYLAMLLVNQEAVSLTAEPITLVKELVTCRQTWAMLP